MCNRKISVTSPFPFDLESRARLTAARLRISRAELVRRAVLEYLDQLLSKEEISQTNAEGTLDDSR